jgi:hypothetical protein
MFQLEEVIDAKFPDLKRKPAMITRPALAFLRMMAGAERDRAHGEDLAVAFDLAERPRADAPAEASTMRSSSSSSGRALRMAPRLYDRGGFGSNRGRAQIPSSHSAYRRRPTSGPGRVA